MLENNFVIIGLEKKRQHGNSLNLRNFINTITLQKNFTLLNDIELELLSKKNKMSVRDLYILWKISENNIRMF